jgi:hypothetical protein
MGAKKLRLELNHLDYMAKNIANCEVIMTRIKSTSVIVGSVKTTFCTYYNFIISIINTMRMQNIYA